MSEGEVGGLISSTLMEFVEDVPFVASEELVLLSGPAFGLALRPRTEAGAVPATVFELKSSWAVDFG